MADEDKDWKHQDETDDDEKMTLKDWRDLVLMFAVFILFALMVAVTGIDLT